MSGYKRPNTDPIDTFDYAQDINEQGLSFENLPCVNDALLNPMDAESFVCIPSGFEPTSLVPQVPSKENVLGTWTDIWFDVSRASTGSRMNSKGLNVSEGNDVPRIDFTGALTETEQGVVNLSRWSQEIGSQSWTVGNSIVELNSTIAPDGTLTATKILGDGAGSFANCSMTVTAVSGQIMYSVYTKKFNSEKAAIRLAGTDTGGGSTSSTYDYDFTTGLFTYRGGTVADLIEATPVGNGWIRISFYLSNTTGLVSGALYPIYNAVTTLGTYFWGAQVEQSSTVGRYVLTTTGSAGVPPLYEQTGCPHLLTEPASENVVIDSQNFSSGVWTKGGDAVVTSNKSVSPDGLMNASNITLSSSAINRLHQTVPQYTGVQTVSVFAKMNTCETVSVNINEFSGIDATVVFSFVSKSFIDTIGDVDSSSFEDVGNGWFRISMVVTTASADATTLSIFGAVVGQVGTDFYLWGVQLEELSYPTSYISTGEVAFGRGEDRVINGGNAGTFNSPAGTLFVDMSMLANTQIRRVITLLGDNADNRVEIQYEQGDINKVRFLVFVENASQMIETITFADDLTEFHKFAITWELNRFTAWFDGVKYREILSGATYSDSALTRCQLQADGGGNQFYGKVKAIKVFDRALTGYELKNLTRP